MKKYIFNPTWDIVPRDGFVELINQVDTTVVRADLPIAHCNALLRGAAFSDLRKLPLSKDKLLSVLRELKEIGAVEYRDIVSQKAHPTKDYLELLNQHCIGPGKILADVATCPIPSENPFYNRFHVCYSYGFAPQCIPDQSSVSGGWGADVNPILAPIKAAVEGVERYALANYDLKDFEIEKSIHVKRLKEVNGDGEVLVPLDSLHHPVNYAELGRVPVSPLNISGVAGHQSFEAAITNAALELCEHEALMVAWYGNRITPAIIHTSLDQESQEHIQHAKELGWQIILKDISLDLVPVVMAVGLGPKGKRALTIGSCAAFTSRYAARKALTEVIRTILVDEALQPTFPNIDREEVNDIATHSYYYAHHNHLEEVAHIWKDGATIEATDRLTNGNHKDLLEAVSEWEEADHLEVGEMHYIVEEVLKHKNIRIYWDTITPHEISKTKIPLVVVRALAPKMTPLTVGYGKIPVESGRFKKLLSEFGNTSAKPGKLHPFS